MNYKSLDDPTNNHTFVYTLSGMTNFTGKTTAFGSYPSVTIPDWKSREGGLIKVGEFSCMYCANWLDKKRWTIAIQKDIFCMDKSVAPACPNMVGNWETRNKRQSQELKTLCGSVNIRCAKEDEALAKCQQDINYCDGVQMDY